MTASSVMLLSGLIPQELTQAQKLSPPLSLFSALSSLTGNCCDSYLPTESNSLDFTVTLAPSDQRGIIEFELVEISRFKGKAMNSGDSEDPDFDFGMSQTGFSAPTTSGSGASTVIRIRTSSEVNSATVRVNARDFGGLAKIRANAIIGGQTRAATVAGSSDGFLKIPRDTDGDFLPNKWETDNGLNANMAGDAERDEDATPMVSGPPAQGLRGDGLSAYEEYRGFMVMGQHQRTDPRVKDLFAFRDQQVNVPGFNTIGLGFIANTGLAAHEILSDPGRERGPMNARSINFNAANGGAGPVETPGHRSQSALGIIFDNADPSVPAMRLGITIPLPLTPNEVTSITIYVNNIRNLGGHVATNTGFQRETFQYVVGHELGHGVHICHSDCQPQNCPPDGATVDPPPPLVICGGGTGPLGNIQNQLFVMHSGDIIIPLVSPTRNPGMGNRPPNVYHNSSIQQIRLHSNQ
jgi:hypothetical protein